MLDLAREGLVEPVPNKGFRVTEVTERDLDEYTAHPDADRGADHRRRSPRPRPAEHWRRCARGAEDIVAAAARGDLIGYLDADRRFHLGLLALGRQRATSSRSSATCASGPGCTASPTSTSTAC